jgi:hypothetical protein
VTPGPGPHRQVAENRGGGLPPVARGESDDRRPDEAAQKRRLPEALDVDDDVRRELPKAFRERPAAVPGEKRPRLQRFVSAGKTRSTCGLASRSSLYAVSVTQATSAPARRAFAAIGRV